MTEPMEDVTVTPPAEGRFERIGTTYYKIVRQPNAAGQLIERSIPWTIEAIRQDYGKDFFSPTCQNTTVSSAVFPLIWTTSRCRQFQEQVFATQPYPRRGRMVVYRIARAPHLRRTVRPRS